MFNVTDIAPYIRVEPLVLDVLSFMGVDPNDACAHFVEVTNKMRACPPNYRRKKIVKDNIWIVRDYYPNTSFMYKVTMVFQSAKDRAEYESTRHRHTYDAKDFKDSLWVNVRFIKSNVDFEKRIHIPYEQGLNYNLQKVANILINDDVKPNPILHFKVKPLKRMFPKGYKCENLPNKRPTHLSDKRKRY